MTVPSRSPVRVLVVDDSVVVRRLVTRVLEDAEGIEVAGTAPNGRIALEKIPRLAPDLITLDVEMPEMDGLETLRRLATTHPSVPVVMFSTLTERGAGVTMEALLRGARDYVTKPANVGSVAESLEQIRTQLVPKIHALTGGPAPSSAPPTPTSRGSSVPARAVGAPTPRAAPASGRVAAVVVGVSTGGPNALAELVPALPADLGVPVLIVQHMPPMFTRLLAERLDGLSALPVREASHGEPVTDAVVLARGDHHLGLRRTGGTTELVLGQGPPENSCRPAADVLFRSAVEVYDGDVLAVVMTGMGADGRRGCGRVRAAGGQVLAQDEATSVVWGMPSAVVGDGLADAVVPLGGLAEEIANRVARSGRSGARTGVA